MKKEFEGRYEKIDSIVKEKKLNGILFSNQHEQANPNFIYATNCSESGIFLLRKNEPRLLTFGWKTKFNAFLKAEHKEKLSNMPKLRGKIGIDEKNISLNLFRLLEKTTKAKFVNVSGDMERIRSIKSDYEIGMIKEGCKTAGKVYRNSERLMHEHHSEIVLKSKVELEMARMGTYPSFPTIVATKENIAEPHHIAGNKIVEKPVLLDFGIRQNNYCTDNTRTIGSKYESLISRIMRETESILKPGALAGDIDRFARKRMGKLRKHFITALGHGIGLAVHEMPVISSVSRDILKENMVITIEPGIYTKNGIRIEDMYLIRKDGCEKLTEF